MTEPADTVRVRPWPDPVIDTLGHDPRSLYVERFWLPTLGPTSLLLVRYIAQRFEQAGIAADPEPGDGVDLPIAETSQVLGLGPREGRNSPLRRSLERLVQFDLAHPHRDGTLAVRRTIPPVSRRHVRRLPRHLQHEHEQRLTEGDGPREMAERRARRIAFVLAELGADVDEAERVLAGLGVPDPVCRSAAQWGRSRHRSLELRATADAGHEHEHEHELGEEASDAA